MSRVPSKELFVTRQADGLELVVDGAGRVFTLPISPSVEFRYKAKKFEIEIKGDTYVYNLDDDDTYIELNGDEFTGETGKAAVDALRPLFFLVSGSDIDLEDSPNIGTPNITSPQIIGDIKQKGANDEATLQTVHTFLNGAPKGGFITDLDNGNVEVGGFDSGFRTRIWSNGEVVIIVKENGEVEFYKDGSGGVVIRPKTAGSVYTGIEWRDFSGTALGRLVQQMATGNILFETHPGGGNPEIQIEYDTREVILTGIRPWKRKFLADEFTYANATINILTDVTGFNFPVKANKRYKFKFVFVFNATQSTNGARFTVNVANGGNQVHLSALAEWSNSSTTTHKNIKVGFEGGSATSGSISNGNRGWVEGEVEMSADDNVQLRVANNLASNAIVVLASKKSYVEWQEI